MNGTTWLTLGAGLAWWLFKQKPEAASYIDAAGSVITDAVGPQSPPPGAITGGLVDVPSFQPSQMPDAPNGSSVLTDMLKNATALDPCQSPRQLEGGVLVFDSKCGCPKGYVSFKGPKGTNTIICGPKGVLTEAKDGSPVYAKGGTPVSFSGFGAAQLPYLYYQPLGAYGRTLPIVGTMPMAKPATSPSNVLMNSIDPGPATYEEPSSSFSPLIIAAVVGGGFLVWKMMKKGKGGGSSAPAAVSGYRRGKSKGRGARCRRVRRGSVSIQVCK